MHLPQPAERPWRAQLPLTASASSLLHRHESPLCFKGSVLAPFTSHMDNRPAVCSMAHGVRDYVILSIMKPICLHMSRVNKKSLLLPWMVQEAPRFTSPGLGAAAPHGHGCLCFCSGLCGHPKSGHSAGHPERKPIRVERQSMLRLLGFLASMRTSPPQAIPLGARLW